jgi:hypothetical protein
MTDHEKFMKFKEAEEENRIRKARAEERFKAAKIAVTAVVTEIKEAGYEDPKQLASVLTTKKTEFSKRLEELGSLLEEEDRILKSVEG